MNRYMFGLDDSNHKCDFHVVIEQETLALAIEKLRDKLPTGGKIDYNDFYLEHVEVNRYGVWYITDTNEGTYP